jgi:hypothetical protein
MVTRAHEYHIEQVYFSDTDECWSQNCRRECGSDDYTIGPIHIHIKHVTMPV